MDCTSVIADGREVFVSGTINAVKIWDVFASASLKTRPQENLHFRKAALTWA